MKSIECDSYNKTFSFSTREHQICWLIEYLIKKYSKLNFNTIEFFDCIDISYITYLKNQQKQPNYCIDTIIVPFKQYRFNLNNIMVDIYISLVKDKCIVQTKFKISFLDEFEF